MTILYFIIFAKQLKDIMVISQKTKNIFNGLYIWGVADNFIVNYDFLGINRCLFPIYPLYFYDSRG